MKKVTSLEFDTLFLISFPDWSVPEHLKITVEVFVNVSYPIQKLLDKFRQKEMSLSVSF